MRKIVSKKTTGKISKKTPFFKNTSMIFLSIALFISMVVVLYQAQQIQELRGSAQTTTCIVPADELTLDSEEKVLFDKINTYRQENGKQPLKLSPSLVRSTAWLSADMNTSKRLNHTDSLGRTMQARLGQCGYPGTLSGGSENIASTGPTAEKAFTVWKQSTEGHNENMLNDKWTVMGIARSGNYWAYNAGITDDSIAAPTNPPVQVPSPACLGSCTNPSLSPAIPSVTQSILPGEPTNNPLPTTSPTEEPEGDAEPSETLPNNPDDKRENRSNTGIIGLFLELLIKLLEFLSSLFRRG